LTDADGNQARQNGGINHIGAGADMADIRAEQRAVGQDEVAGIRLKYYIVHRARTREVHRRTRGRAFENSRVVRSRDTTEIPVAGQVPATVIRATRPDNARHGCREEGTVRIERHTFGVIL
jgi:hypothetical protein